MKHTKQPIALTIAGSDSGGGAGVQADLKTFAALGLHGASAITCLTAQNPKAIRRIELASPGMVRQQIESSFAELPPAAVKTGMLASAGIIRVVVKLFQSGRRPPLIIDPVMVATSGAQLLTPAGLNLLQRELLPLATLATPNLAEASQLVGWPVKTLAEMRQAAREINARFGCAALVKGGHLRGVREAADIFYDGQTELLLCAPFIRNVKTHGTGCTYSAAITGYLALGHPLPDAVQRAKTFITQAISRSRTAARHRVLNFFWKP